MGYCVGGKWVKLQCVKCKNTRTIYTTDPLWLFIKEHKNCKCEKCENTTHNIF